MDRYIVGRIGESIIMLSACVILGMGALLVVGIVILMVVDPVSPWWVRVIGMWVLITLIGLGLYTLGIE